MVQVLMSTYNGEKYVREQIDSILGQTYQDIQVLIRDDGSQDGTLFILKDYSEKYNNIKYYSGENLGTQNSFYDLFDHVDDAAEYIATCDQDDVWYPDKIESAVQCLDSLKEPGLYCCRTQITDENLNPLKDKLRDYTPKIAFGNALIENICTGCTMVVNRQFYNLVKNKWPQKSLIHDWWFYLTAVSFGKVFYDNQPHIYYRQHGDNVIGLDTGRWGLIKRQIKSFRRFRGTYTAQIEEFLQTFSLEGENKYLASLMAGTKTSWKCRVKILFERRIFRQGKFDNLLFKGMMFLGIL